MNKTPQWLRDAYLQHIRDRISEGNFDLENVIQRLSKTMPADEMLAELISAGELDEGETVTPPPGLDCGLVFVGGDPCRGISLQQTLIGTDFIETERGNTWIFEAETGRHEAWFELIRDEMYLGVSIRPEDSPAFYVSVDKATRESIRDCINKHFGGWCAVRCNIPGVRVDSDNYTVDDVAVETDPDIQYEVIS